MTSVTSTEQPDTNSCVGLPDILWKSWESNARSVIRPRFGSAEPRKQKHDRRDADLILKLLVENRYPKIWLPSKEQQDMRALLRIVISGYAYGYKMCCRRLL